MSGKVRSKTPSAPTVPPRRGPARLLVPVALVAGAFGLTYLATRLTNRPPGPPPGMVLVPGGKFVMGAAGETRQKNELPAHSVRVDGFFMDEAEVTNAQFRVFVEATGYLTTAERPVDWDELKKQFPPGTPKAPADRLMPGSLLFTPPNAEIPTNDMSRWWT